MTKKKVPKPKCPECDEELGDVSIVWSRTFVEHTAVCSIKCLIESVYSHGYREGCWDTEASEAY